MIISIFLQTRPKPVIAPSNENHHVTDNALTRVNIHVYNVHTLAHHMVIPSPEK